MTDSLSRGCSRVCNEDDLVDILVICAGANPITIHVQRDNEGYLLDPSQWTIALAHEIAAGEDINLTDEHWVVITFVRDYFEQQQTVPIARTLLQHLQESLGSRKASRRYLHALFPYGYGQQACKIAGMRKPLKLMLDV